VLCCVYCFAPYTAGALSHLDPLLIKPQLLSKQRLPLLLPFGLARLRRACRYTNIISGRLLGSCKLTISIHEYATGVKA
jgi:hypothetical protein